MEEDVRWRQRFDNYKRALGRIEQALTILPDLFDERQIILPETELSMEGLVHRFEFTYELAWKTLGDLLKHRGYEGPQNAKQIFQTAAKEGLIKDLGAWFDIKRFRNKSSHEYYDDIAIDISQKIVSQFLSLFQELEATLEKIDG